MDSQSGVLLAHCAIDADGKKALARALAARADIVACISVSDIEQADASRRRSLGKTVDRRQALMKAAGDVETGVNRSVEMRLKRSDFVVHAQR